MWLEIPFSSTLVIGMCILTDWYPQMWVNIDDWHENPEIIHTKFN